MKANMFFNRAYFMVTTAAVVFTVTACNTKTDPQTEDTSQVAAEQNDAKFDNKKLERDAQFLVDAATLDLEEIKLGQLAIQKGSTGDVRNLGKMMVEMHTRSLKEVTDLAKTKQVTIPDSISNDSQDAYNSLNDKTGNDFNKAFCERLVEGHQDVIGKFEKISSDSRDQEIKQWATARLPQLRSHLDSVFATQKKIDKL